MRFIIFSLALIQLGSPTLSTAQPLTIYAATSTLPLMAEIQSLWSNQGGSIKLRVVHGSSGALSRQITAGAPADVYISANPKWINRLIQNKIANPITRKTILKNRLVLIAPANAKPLKTKSLLSEIPAILANRGHLVLGDPRHVPAGQYAQEVLDSLGISQHVKAMTVHTNNVRLALALVQRGEAALGIVYHTDARNDPSVKILQTFPTNLHSAIKYEAVSTRSGHPYTNTFLAMLASAAAKTIYRNAGFIVRD
ncbi:MAG: molybdate ABC transporter substrate-binding protein [Pseudomonadota bacterium]|nr:molybdate ABC transporter substrate-binding protein [Pseudomonadota bacterium]